MPWAEDWICWIERGLMPGGGCRRMGCRSPLSNAPVEPRSQKVAGRLDRRGP